MKNTNTGGPAFPTESEHQSGENRWHFEGMTLRDYFAAKALNGMLSRDAYAGGWCPKENSLECGVKRVARFAYEYADAMIAEREKQNG